MVDAIPPFEAYIVARHQGRRVLIPLEPDAKITFEWPHPRHRTPDTAPSPMKVTVTGTCFQYRIWEDGANPEQFHPSRTELTPAPLQLEEGTTHD